MSDRAAPELSHDWRGTWDFGDPAASEARFRAELATLPDAARRAEVLTQIARAQGLQSRFAAAHATLDEVAAAADAPGFVRVRLLLERGRVLNSSGSVAEARPLFEQAFDLARRSGEDDLAVDAAHMVAIAVAGDESLRWNLEALSLAESSPSPRARRWTASLHNNLGWTLHALERYDEALVEFEAALAERVGQGSAEEIGIARWCVARCLRSLGRVDEALTIQRELLREHEANGTTSSYVFEELAACLSELGHHDEAAEWRART